MPTDAPCGEGRNRCRAQRVKWSHHDVARVEALGDFFLLLGEVSLGIQVPRPIEMHNLMSNDCPIGWRTKADLPAVDHRSFKPLARGMSAEWHCERPTRCTGE